MKSTPKFFECTAFYLNLGRFLGVPDPTNVMPDMCYFHVKMYLQHFASPYKQTIYIDFHEPNNDD